MWEVSKVRLRKISGWILVFAPVVLTTVPGVHIECKRVERLNIYDAIEQSKNDARDGENPVVMHRRNRKEWLVTMPLDDWMKMYGKALHDN